MGETDIRAKHAAATRKEIGALRGWLDYIERDIAQNKVIHAMLLTEISESCTKIVYHAGIINGVLLKESE